MSRIVPKLGENQFWFTYSENCVFHSQFKIDHQVLDGTAWRHFINVQQWISEKSAWTTSWSLCLEQTDTEKRFSMERTPTWNTLYMSPCSTCKPNTVNVSQHCSINKYVAHKTKKIQFPPIPQFCIHYRLSVFPWLNLVVVQMPCLLLCVWVLFLSWPGVSPY